MRVTIDRDTCIGAGQCVLAEPEVFDQDEDDGRVRLLTPDVPPEATESLELAVRGCPVRALGLDDESAQ